MMYDFDRIIERRGTYSIKYDMARRGKPEDVLPLWVADMDFLSPPCVSRAVAERAEHGIFGYSEPDSGYMDVLKAWFEKRFGWSVRPEWLAVTPGVVNAVHIAIRALTEAGDGIVIQEPVYYPFARAVRDCGRKLLVNELIYDGKNYSIDFEDFEKKISAAKLFVLCSPHNPVGRVWTREELTRMGEICLRHGVTVLADEIHQDFVYPGHKHQVFANINEAFADISLTCTSPSKTFNLAGLMHANIFIANKDKREAFKREYANCGLSQPGLMGITACKAAYEGGEEWLEELLAYLAGNFSFIREFLKEELPEIKLVKPEGTYLAWLDCSRLNLSARELDERIVKSAKLWLDDGAMFGSGGAGFQRLNAACPRSVLKEAFGRLKSAF